MPGRSNPRLRLIVFFGAVAALAVPLAGIGGSAQPPPQPANAVILVTLDGARTEEIFGGLDVDILRSTIAKDADVLEQPVYKRFYAPTPEARRERLMPFFW